MTTAAGRLSVPHGVPHHADGATFWYFPRQTGFYKFSAALTRWLARMYAEFDLVHIHALFSHCSLAAALRPARGRPYMVRPLGTLNRWGIRNRRPWLKRLSFRVLESGILASPRAMHYTCERKGRRRRIWAYRNPRHDSECRVTPDPGSRSARPLSRPFRLAQSPWFFPLPFRPEKGA